MGLYSCCGFGAGLGVPVVRRFWYGGLGHRIRVGGFEAGAYQLEVACARSISLDSAIWGGLHEGVIVWKARL